MFNTQRLVRQTIRRMTDAVHPSMTRLIEAAVAARLIKDPAGHGSIAVIARKLNESDQVLRNWAARGVSSRGAVAAASAFGSDANWILAGVKPPTQMIYPKSFIDGEFAKPTIGTNEPAAARYLANVERAAEIDRKGLVPLISWVQAGAWGSVEDPFATGDAEDWLPCPVRHGPRTYCLRVRGESMKNPDGKPSYDHGDIIYVDPDQEGLSGNRIITRLDDTAEATFKQLVEEDGKRLLKALNPEWSPRYLELNVDATYCGKVIGKWVSE